MVNKTDINNQTEKILESLDGIRRASPQPFFYTRLIGRMQMKTTSLWEKMASIISKPTIAIAMIALFLLINITVIFHFSSNPASTGQNDSAVISDNEYSLSVSSLYDINPEQNDIAQK